MDFSTFGSIMKIKGHQVLNANINMGEGTQMIIGLNAYFLGDTVHNDGTIHCKSLCLPNLQEGLSGHGMIHAEKVYINPQYIGTLRSQLVASAEIYDVPPHSGMWDVSECDQLASQTIMHEHEL